MEITKKDVALIAMEAATGILAMSGLKGQEQPLFMEAACDLTGYSQATIYSLIHKKEIPFHKVAGRRRLFFYKSELISWMEKKEVCHGN
ncbi:MAG: helix-turn-helix domain-containing protein [Chitinophagaceae bacterium]